MPPTTPTRPVQPSEQGYVLVALIFMLLILILTLSVAAPRVARQIQRDRELETFQRGKQYIRGIKMYYKKFGRYPPNIDALIKTNEIRFLRRKYVDPTTGKEEWKPIPYGQNKVPTAYGFFGQPLGASSIAGTGPSGGNGLQGLSSSMTSNSPFASNPSTATDANSTHPNGTAPTDPNAAAGGSAFGSGSGSNSGSSSGGSSSGLNGQTFGGAGIIGFSPNSPKQSILAYKKKTHYNEWEFVYDPLSEQMQIPTGAATGLPTSTPGQSSTSSSPFGQSTSGPSSFGAPGSGISTSPTPTN